MKRQTRKLMSLLLTLVMLLSLLPTTAFAADRTVVSNVVAVSDSDMKPEYGKPTANHTFTVTEGQPAYFTMGGWYKKNGDRWLEMSLGENFGEGTYRYNSQLRIDETTHVLASEGLSVIVGNENWDLISANDVTADGEKWNEGSVKVYDGFSFVWVASPEFTLNASENQPLTFLDADRFDIGKNYVGRAITPFSVAGNVEGGKKPYTFSRASGPAWISVSEEGVISGTPTEAGTNEDLVVQVKDKKGAIATITIDVADTKINPDDRTVVSVVKAKFPDDYTLPEYGDQVTEPTLIVTEGEPAYFPDTMQHWYKKNGDRWLEMSLGETFGEGTYRYTSQLRIDDASGTTHVLASEGLSVIVDGKNWDLISANEVTADGEKWNEGSVKVYDEFSFVSVASTDFNIVAPGLEFDDSDVFDIGKNYVDRAITSYSVAGNVKGGTQPYKFEKVSGPEWINVSNEGVISGTPTAAGTNTDLLVQVTDNKGAVKTIRIDVGDTKINPANREKISTVTATSDINPKYGKLAAEPAFTITEGQPAYLNDNNWQKKVDGVWTNMSAGDTFEVGTYRYKAELRIDGKNFDGKDGTTHVLAQNNGLTLTVDGKAWEVMNPVDVMDDTSSVTVYSVEFTVKKSIVALDVKGIIPPVDGETADTSGIIINNNTSAAVSSAQWLKANGNEMGASETFEGNNTYYLVIKYDVADGYELSDNVDVLHDLTGGNANHNASVKTIMIAYTVPKTYTVTVTTDGNGTAEASPVKAAAGTTVTLTATPNEGYELDKWEIVSPTSFTLPANSFTMPANNVIVKASFKVKATVTTINTINITGITAPVADKSPVTDGITTDTTGVTLKTIQWEKMGGVIMGSSEKFEVGQTYTLYISYEPQSGYEISNTVTVTSDLENSNVNATSARVNIQYTVPEAATYTVAVTDGTARQVTPVDGEYATTIETKAGNRILLKADDKEGKVFIGWSGLDGITLYGDGTTVEDATLQFIMPEKNVAVTANYIDESADNVIKNIDITGITTPLAGATPEVGGITINTERVDYSRAAWNYNGAYLGFDDTFEKGEKYCLYVFLKLDEGYSVANDVTITADIDYDNAFVRDEVVFIYYTVTEDAPASYTVTFAANGGSGTMADVTGVSGEYTLPACGFTAPDGKQFKAWSVGGVEKAAGDKITVTVDTTVTAVWENVPAPAEYAITVDGGTASVGAGTAVTKATAGTEITLTVDESAIPAGKVFDKWEVVSGGVTVADGKFTMPESAVEINATYKDAPVSHTCDIKPVAKDEPSCTEGGKEAYYKCEGCGKFYEDALGAKEITDLANWGNLPKLGHTESDWKSDKDDNKDGKCDVCEYNVGLPTTPDDDKPNDNPQTGDNSNMFLWIALLFISGAGVVATTVFGKKKFSVK